MKVIRMRKIRLRSGAGSAHHKVQENGIIPRICKADVQFVGIVLEHFEHLHGGMILLQIAGASIGQMQEYLTVAISDFIREFFHIGDQHKFKHIYHPFRVHSFH